SQKGETIWITGLHGSGKNELAFSLEKKLFENGAVAVLIDGSSVRSGLNRELDFSPADRAENLRRVAHICKLLNDQGIITICSFISRNESLRTQVAEIIGKEKFHLFYMDATLEYCKNNKPELYELIDQGKTENLPGVDLEFEEPTNAKLVFNPVKNEENIDKILEYLAANKVFPFH
ncbi:MAG: adenylyl-sulfate kinase, partial [Draconibacterium sp.]|nr:adenylyl-sulfate kinase [Draconibacterium sp.]